MATVCLGLLSSTFLLVAIGVGARYSIVYAEMWGRLLNSTLETEALQIRIQNLTEERNQINTSYYLNMNELEKAKETMVSCPEGWSRFGLSCYYLSSTTKTWAGSSWYCQNEGANLVIVNNQREMEFLNKLGASFWIGLSRSSGDWQWTDGSFLVTSFWQSGHPIPMEKRYYIRGKNCAAFNRYSVFLSSIKSWSSLHCDSKQQCVCEKEAHVPSLK